VADLYRTPPSIFESHKASFWRTTLWHNCMLGSSAEQRSSVSAVPRSNIDKRMAGSGRSHHLGIVVIFVQLIAWGLRAIIVKFWHCCSQQHPNASVPCGNLFVFWCLSAIINTNRSRIRGGRGWVVIRSRCQLRLASGSAFLPSQLSVTVYRLWNLLGDLRVSPPLWMRWFISRALCLSASTCSSFKSTSCFYKIRGMVTGSWALNSNIRLVAVAWLIPSLVIWMHFAEDFMTLTLTWL